MKLLKQPLIIASLAIFVACLLFGYVATLPAYSNWQSKTQLLAQQEGEVESLQSQRKSAKKLAAIKPTLEEKATLAKELFPVEEKRESFVTELDDLSHTTGVTLGTLNFVATTKPKKVEDDTDTKKTAIASPTTPTVGKPLSFTANITGEYQSIVQFLAQLNSLKRYTLITSVALGSSEGGTVSATLEGNIYTLPASKAPKKFDIAGNLTDYLDRQATPIEPLTSGRSNPFANY